MRVINVVDEDFINYYKPSMFIGTISCSGKCCLEAGIPLSVCQNDGWREIVPIELDDDVLCQRYLENSLTSAIVFGGLEPFEQWQEIAVFINKLRFGYECADDIVIYTGYYPDEAEVKTALDFLNTYPNIIVKFGRYIPNSSDRFDDVLGVKLSSINQYAERIS